MAIWGIGVMLGPIMGPTLGAWLTDNYSWHWVFFINLPIGILTVLGLMVFMDETKTAGTSCVSTGSDSWRSLSVSARCNSCSTAASRSAGSIPPKSSWRQSIAVVGFYYFFAHSLTTATPFVRFELFKDRNFVAGCIFMVVIGVVLFGTMALVTPFMQNVIGYPILSAGMLLAARGIGTLVAMIIVGRLMQVDRSALARAGRARCRELHALSDGRLHRPDLVLDDRDRRASFRASGSAWCSFR